MNSLADFLWAMLAFYFLFMCIWIFIRIFADIFRRQDLTGIWKVVWILVLFWIPFFGAMVYLIARPKVPMEAEAASASETAQPQAVAVSAAAPASPSTADEITKLAQLRDSGAISPAEFDAAKAKALAA